MDASDNSRRYSDLSIMTTLWFGDDDVVALLQLVDGKQKCLGKFLHLALDVIQSYES